MSLVDWNFLVSEMSRIFNQCFVWLYNIRIGPLSLLEFHLAFLWCMILFNIIMHLSYGQAHVEAGNRSRARGSEAASDSYGSRVSMDADYPKEKF